MVCSTPKGDHFRCLTDENKNKLGYYFDPGETCITVEELKERRIQRRFYV